jgi:hypothetical protein
MHACLSKYYILTYLSVLRIKLYISSFLEEANPSPSPIYYYPERPVSRLPKPNAETGGLAATKVPERELLGKSRPHPAVKPLGKLSKYYLVIIFNP